MCCISKTQRKVLGISALDLWKSQPWPVVFTFPTRGQDGWSRFPLSEAGQLIQQGWLSCRDDLKGECWQYHIKYIGQDSVTSFLTLQQTYRCQLPVIASWQAYKATTFSRHPYIDAYWKKRLNSLALWIYYAISNLPLLSNRLPYTPIVATAAYSFDR